MIIGQIYRLFLLLLVPEKIRLFPRRILETTPNSYREATLNRENPLLFMPKVLFDSPRHQAQHFQNIRLLLYVAHRRFLCHLTGTVL